MPPDTASPSRMISSPVPFPPEQYHISTSQNASHLTENILSEPKRSESDVSTTGQKAPDLMTKLTHFFEGNADWEDVNSLDNYFTLHDDGTLYPLALIRI